jgi:hypothetical protein
MRVNIGPYLNYWGTYQIADLLKYVGVSESCREKIGDWLEKTPLSKILLWIDNKRNRKVEVRIDKYDTWSMDKTLPLIIIPMLIQLKKTKHGVPASMYDEDDAWSQDRLDANAEAKWDNVLSEMIWAFEQTLDDQWPDKYTVNLGKYHFENRDGKDEIVWDEEPVIDREGIEIHQKRIDDGLALFGKHYQSLWD